MYNGTVTNFAALKRLTRANSTLMVDRLGVDKRSSILNEKDVSWAHWYHTPKRNKVLASSSTSRPRVIDGFSRAYLSKIIDVSPSFQYIRLPVPVVITVIDAKTQTSFALYESPSDLPVLLAT